ncbi:YihY family inner membrane protein [Xylophilus sp.]|uniref:YihY family inner membrane protein n=1 Tax=Xylophilus sp. TaxID=2653893 RepID=UPI0013B9AF2F|nr:YihY family inner membrane protein [Xylophilus sp.]KAF1042268.1 MAG: hypothetical protein GAK38_04380 [Xylophilus sp.]
MPALLSALSRRLRVLARDLSRFPWRSTAVTLRERFREDRLGLTAGSLTCTTMLALVPFFTVALAVFTAFPMFHQVQLVLQRWLVDSLVPDSISRQVLGYLTQFASKASRLGVAGLSVLLATALALVLTIDRTLNGIWRVPRPRPLGQRVLVYWAVITLGPLVLGLSLLLTSYVISASRGLVGTLPGGIRLLLDSIEVFLLAGGMAGLYHYVPNTAVRWTHAWVGGLFVAACMELAKRILAAYLDAVPTYSVVYGAFAALPTLLVWIYVAWVIVLLGAVIVAYLPSLLDGGVARHATGPGWPFQLALESVQQLEAAKARSRHGLTVAELSSTLGAEALQVAQALDAMVALDWIGRLVGDEGDDALPRYVLLADPDATPLAPLMHRLLLAPDGHAAALWAHERWGGLRLREALNPAAVTFS